MAEKSINKWQKVNFDSFFDVLPSKKYQVQRQDYLSNGDIPVVDQGQSLIAGYTNDKSKIFNHDKVIIFGDHTRIVKYIDFEFAVGADGTQILGVKQNINLKFAYYQLLNKKIPDTGYNRHFKYVKAEDYYIPPTFEEQQEIVDVLDAASEIIRLRTACIESAQSLIPALFQEMFGDPLNNNKNLTKEKIGKIFTLTSGKFIPSKELDTNGQYPVYGGNGINGYHNEFLFEDSKICIGRVGVKCGCVHKTKPNSWITDNALYINNYLIPINETYLKEALTQINLNQYAKRAAQPVISQTTIYNQYLLLPPIAQQELFATKVQEIEAYIKTQQTELENAKTMFQSLLHYAFMGKLTENITFEVKNE